MPKEEDLVCVRSSIDADNFWARPRDQNQITKSFRVINNIHNQKRNKISNQSYQQIINNPQNLNIYNDKQQELQNQYISKIQQIENDNLEIIENDNLETIEIDKLNILDTSHDSLECNNDNSNTFIESFQIKQDILINEIENLELKYQQLQINYNLQIKKLLKINTALVNYINKNNSGNY